MAWYRTGSVNLTNASVDVVGVGTLFLDFVDPGEGILLPDGKIYEISSVVSNTLIRLRTPGYQGVTATGQDFEIIPIQGYVRELAHDAAALIDAHREAPTAAIAARDEAVAARDETLVIAASIEGVEQQVIDAQAAATAAAGHVTTALSHSDKAQQWANANEDVAVEPSLYSAKHWSIKSSGHATTAAGHVATALTHANTAAGHVTTASGHASAASTHAGTALSHANTASTHVTKAQKWASENFNVQVEPGLYSAKHWASISQNHATASAVHSSTASDWANLDQNVEVEPGLYSAKHWALEAASVVTNGVIDDATSGLTKTWSSSKIQQEITNAAPSSIDAATLTGTISSSVFPNSGATAGSYGTTIQIPNITVNEKGLVTAISTSAVRTATTGQTGVVMLNNTLTSTSTTQALTAARGKELQDNKVDKVVGKQLSTEDFTTEEKNKLATIAENAQAFVGTDLAITGAGDGRAITSSTGVGFAVPVATTAHAGFMSIGDKSKLDNIAPNANNYTHPTGDGNSHVPATGTTNNGKVLKAGSTANSASWGQVAYNEITDVPTTFTPSTHTHSNLTITAGNGLSGGGDLSASRTLTLGTPGTLTTSTTNSVTSTSHTHAVTFPVNTSANVFIGKQTISLSTGQSISAMSGGTGQLEVLNDSAAASPAVISFHRGSSYAVHFGLDTDNKLKVGGWSMGAAAYEIHSARGISPVAVAALSVDCSSGCYFTKTISANSTFTFDSVPASVAYSFTLEVTHTSGTITWPTSVQWPNNKAPTLTAGKTHLFMFSTVNGGTRWRGAALVDYTN